MNIKPDLAMGYGLPVAEHPDPRCRNCGTPPATFELNGEVKPNRIVTVGGPKAKEYGSTGTYCEKCVCLANKIAAQKREQKQWQQTLTSRANKNSRTSGAN